VAADIAAIINACDAPYYVEPFVGGASVLALVKKEHRLALDVESNLIWMWKAVQQGWVPPTEVSRELYSALRNHPHDSALKGFVAYGCSWGGKFFGGYASGDDRNFADEGSRRITNKVAPHIKDVFFDCCDYKDAEAYGEGWIFYCDPPFLNTATYSAGGVFNHQEFWSWADSMANMGHVMLVSETEAPDGWDVCWEKEVTSSYTALEPMTKRSEKLFARNLD